MVLASLGTITGPIVIFLIIDAFLIVAAIIAQFGTATRQKRLDEVSKLEFIQACMTPSNDQLFEASNASPTNGDNQNPDENDAGPNHTQQPQVFL